MGWEKWDINRVNKRKAAGLCWRCGEPAYPERSMCLFHLAKDRARYHAKKRYDISYPEKFSALSCEVTAEVGAYVRRAVRQLRGYGLTTKDMISMVHRYADYEEKRA